MSHHNTRAKLRLAWLGVLGAAAVLLAASANPAEAGAIRAGFNAGNLPANDDGSTGSLSIGFNINFFGNTYSNLFANNNGNATFNSPQSTYTPFGLTTTTGIPIIAPFFADVDTRGAGSDLLRYGSGTVGTHSAFGMTWDGVGVGYYYQHTNLLNQFQMVLIDRSDTGAGNFDIEFDYNQIQWETGDASGGSGGFGGAPAHAGFSNGSGTPGTNFELPGSGVTMAFEDTNPVTGLVNNSFNSGGVLGRYVYEVRNGVPQTSVPVPPTAILAGLGFVGCMAGRLRRRKAAA